MAARPQRRVLAEILARLTDRDGRYSAVRLAQALDWTQEEIASYLGKSPSTVSKNPTALTSQDALAKLAALLQHVAELTGDLAQARTWLRTPARALDGASPKELIMLGELDPVDMLLREYESGLAF
jgi:transcriptional regulator with XRE-family HTH domain